MFTTEKNTTENKTASLYEATDTIGFQLGENQHSSKATFLLRLEKRPQYNNQIVLNRTNFKIDDKEVEKKFPKISTLYFSSVFPLVLTYHEANYQIAEFRETAKRIMENDLTMRDNFSGDGFEYIRELFLERVKNQSEFQKFMELLPVYQVLNASASPNFKPKEFGFQWNIAGLGCIQGTGDFKLDAKENKMTFILKHTSETAIMELVEEYIAENDIQMSFSKNEFPEISFSIETLYNDALSSIQNSKAELNIAIGEKFKYTQNFSLIQSLTNN